MSAGYERDELLGVRRATISLSDLATAPEHNNAVGDIHDIGYVLTFQDYGAAAFGQATRQGEHLARFGDRERRGRLIHDHQPGAEVERAANRHRLPTDRRTARQR